MEPYSVVELEVSFQTVACLSYSLVAMQINLLVLDGSPEPLHKDIVKDPLPLSSILIRIPVGISADSRPLKQFP